MTKRAIYGESRVRACQSVIERVMARAMASCCDLFRPSCAISSLRTSARHAGLLHPRATACSVTSDYV